jgi:DNA repair protein RecO (recombination protein O)
VSASAGEPYRDRLLPLPAFLTKARQAVVTEEDVRNGLKLTGHFLESRILAARGEQLPEVRGRILGLARLSN